jgi:AcrR family transcriptional regulator
MDSAARLFVERGYEAASLEEIAEQAGFSRGAFYSNFRNKEDLLLEVLEAQTSEILAAVAHAFTVGTTADERLAHGGKLIDRIVNHDVEWCRLYVEIYSVAMRNEKIRRRLADQYRPWRSAVAGMIEAQVADLGVELDVAPQELALTYVALFEGYVLQKLIDPEALPPDFFERLLIRFFGRVRSTGSASPGRGGMARGPVLDRHRDTASRGSEKR